jgi:hypothetical protein
MRFVQKPMTIQKGNKDSLINPAPHLLGLYISVGQYPKDTVVGHH